MYSHDLLEHLILVGSSCSNMDEASGLILHKLSKSAAMCSFILSGWVKIDFKLIKSSLIDNHPSSDSILLCKFVKNLCCLSVLHA